MASPQDAIHELREAVENRLLSDKYYVAKKKIDEFLSAIVPLGVSGPEPGSNVFSLNLKANGTTTVPVKRGGGRSPEAAPVPTGSFKMPRTELVGLIGFVARKIIVMPNKLQEPMKPRSIAFL